MLLEAAFFAPAAIAGRGRRYGLVTDAGQRFERGVDPAHQERAIERATQLLLEIAGGNAGPVHVDAGSPTHLPQPRSKSRCAASASRACSARTIADNDVKATLEALGHARASPTTTAGS